jgi:AcrR family transcriptional regulator
MAVKSKRRKYRSEARAASVDEGRARMIEAGRKLLSGGKGVPAFSIDAVAREAGVTRATVYNQFESKQGLLTAVFDSIAQEGGLFDLPRVFAEADPNKALRRVVAIFASFWRMHAQALPKFAAFGQLDAEIGVVLNERSERRRKLLTAIVGRMKPVHSPADLVDVLFALTSAEFYRHLAVSGRSANAVEELIWRAVEDAVERFGKSGA